MPFEKGVYEVAPGIKRLGTDFGNGAEDAKVFQFDSRFDEYRSSKLACRRDRLSKYYLEHEHSDEVAAAIARLIVDRLRSESPEHFAIERVASGDCALFCRLTGETLLFDADMKLLPESTTQVRYTSAFDALAMQVQEDLNVVRAVTDETGAQRDWLSTIHVCAPSTWKPEDKVGKSFVGVHAPVPTSENLLKAASGIVQAMIHKGPYVRFNWGLTGNPQPNHYPDAPPGISQAEWRGPAVKAINQNEIYMWVERQVVMGCPAVDASLFTIRPHFVPLREIRADAGLRERFIASLESMVPEVLEYKGLDEARGEVIAWMKKEAPAADLAPAGLPRGAPLRASEASVRL
jgi:hypothetical protein